MRALALACAAALLVAGCAALGIGQPDADAPLPYPAGCAAYELSARRCEAIVHELARRAAIEPAEATRIELLGDPGCNDVELDPGALCVRTSSFVVRVRFTMPDGHTLEESQFCGVGGQFSILCTETPEINVWTLREGYFDVPCAGEPPDGCATRFPAPDATAAAAERPLLVDRLEIPIDHPGAHEVVVGVGALANGLLDEAEMRLVVASSGLLLRESGIGLVLESLEPDGRPFDNYYLHGRREGVERFRAIVRFDVLAFQPGASIVLADIVVR